MLARLLSCVSLGALLLATACGAVDDDGGSEGACGIDGCAGPCAESLRCQRYELSACSPGAGSVYDPLDGLSLSTPTAFLALYEASAADGSDAVVLHRQGTLCADATDQAACNRSFDALDHARGWPATREPVDGPAPQARHHVAFTRGDAVGVITTIDELRALVGPIDNVKDAALLVTESLDHSLSCGNYASPVAGGGYTFGTKQNTSRTAAGCVDAFEHIDVVDAAGNTSTRRSEAARFGGGCQSQ